MENNNNGLDVSLKEVEVKEVETQEVESEMINDYFRWVKGKDGLMIAMGNQLISNKKFRNVKECKKYLESGNWELLMNVIVGLIEMSKNIK